jgi:HlyD family secretion protein
MRGKRIAEALMALGAIGGGIAWLSVRAGSEKAPNFLTASIRRGDLVSTISATGTIEPEAAVDVGAQVAGVIVGFGLDKHGKEVTWSSNVEKGEILALIDDSLYAAAVKTAAAQVAEVEANVLAAQASVQAAEANVLQQRANLLYATENWDRAQKLGPSDALAQSAFDQYRDNYETAKANVAAAEAAVQQTRAAVTQEKAALDQDKAALLTAQINLNYCTIRSPVKGVIIDRRVNIGQTVFPR